MNEHSTPKASPDTFDGDAISRADREFLASLSDHPLVRHPLYSVPPPPRPNYDGCTTIDERAEAQRACFPAALDWMLVNYAYCTAPSWAKAASSRWSTARYARSPACAASCSPTRSWKKARGAGSRRRPSSMSG